MKEVKTLKAFRLSEEAIRVLDNQPNATAYIESLIVKGSSQSSSASLTKEDFLKGLQTLENIIKTNGRGSSPQAQATQKVYNGKFLVGVEDIKDRDCSCPYETNERGLNERVGTTEDCPVHDPPRFDEL
jgi:hypothetical protein